MSDSVDRVFSHALKTVNKIRTGTAKPPGIVRLKLYGLYKQSMEGDVDGIMEKPRGSDEPSRRAREKWEAWHAQSGLSRTEAKRRYITMLIETMHKYASASNESRELVSELEFVWDQVKSNVPSSNSSSPLRTSTLPLNLSQDDALPHLEGFRHGVHQRAGSQEEMHVISPVSKEQLEFEAIGEVEDDEEFVDAPDSQVDRPLQQHNVHAVLSSPSRGPPLDQDMTMSDDKRRKKRPYIQPSPAPSGDEMWKKNISASIIRLTAELAAVREQLEARRLFTHKIQFRIFRLVTTAIWSSVKHIAIDVIALGVLLFWLRQKQDRRLESALRVLLGDAVVQAQKLGDKQLTKIQLPLLTTAGKKSSR